MTSSKKSPPQSSSKGEDRDNLPELPVSDNDVPLNADTDAETADTEYWYTEDDANPTGPDISTESDYSRFELFPYYDTNYNSAKELVNAADRIVLARIESISFEKPGSAETVLKKDVADVGLSSSVGDIVTVYRILVLEDYTFGMNGVGAGLEFRLYGGNTTCSGEYQSAICGEKNVPVIFTGEDICEGVTYLLLLDEHDAVTTLVDPKDGVYIPDGPSFPQSYTFDDIMDEIK